MSVFSLKFRPNFVFRASTIRKRVAKCQWKRHPKISPKIGWSRKIGDFLKKSPPIAKNMRYFDLFRWYFSNFLRKSAPPLAADPTTPNFPMFIWRSRFGPSSNSQFQVHLMVQIEVRCDPTARIEPQQLCDDPMVRFRPDFDQTANFVLQQ